MNSDGVNMAQVYSAQASYALTDVLATLIFCVCCTASFTLNLGTVVMLVFLRGGGTLKNMIPELRLFVHSLVMLILQAALVSHLLLQSWDFVASTTRAYGLFAWTFPSGRPSTSAELFFGMFSETELFENRDQLDLTCLYDLTECGLLYGVLSGRQVIVGALTVGDLTQHVFAQSGSLFLLLMSSLVRNAYVDFYFKRFRRRNKVNIIRVTPTNSGAHLS